MSLSIRVLGRELAVAGLMRQVRRHHLRDTLLEAAPASLSIGPIVVREVNDDALGQGYSCVSTTSTPVRIASAPSEHATTP